MNKKLLQYLPDRSNQKIILFFISPFLSSLVALKNIKSRSSLCILFSFFILFGLSFNPINEDADSFRYAEDYRQFYQDADNNFQRVVDNYFGEMGASENKDLYVHFMFYISSKIGGSNIHVLFGLFAFVFAFFCICSLRFILENPNFKYCLSTYILLFLFLYSNNIFNINGVRFWTASWMGVYMTFKIIINKDNKWFIGLLLLPLIHIGFLAYIAIFFIAFLLKKKVNLLFKCFIISFFLGELGFIILDYLKESLPPLLQHMIWSYTESDWAVDRMDGATEPLYARILNSLPRYYELILLFIIGINRKSVKHVYKIGFTLAFFSIVNLFSAIPGCGRFYVVGYPFVIYLWIDNLKLLQKYKYILEFVPLVYFYSVFQWLRDVLSVTNLTMYTSNFFHIILRTLIFW